MIERKGAEPVYSERAFLNVFTKREGTLRFWIKYRRADALSKSILHTILLVQEHIDSVNKAAVFSTLDANSGYWQMEIDENSGDESAFASHHELFEFI